MDNKNISITRLVNQQIVSTKFKTPKELVGWMGVMQAQDYLMAKQAIGVRLTGSTDFDIDEAVSSGNILRTHLLRPTWHFVSPDDIRWMLELSAPNIKASMRSRKRQLELTDAVIKKCNRIIEKALSNGEHLTRDVIVSFLEKGRIAMGDNRAAHILMYAELDGLICSGKVIDKKQSYTLLDERVPVKKSFSKDEALALLAGKYFQSHGPAKLADFMWWSGLSSVDSKKALDMVKHKLDSFTHNGQTYWGNEYDKEKECESVYLLPAYDEFLISYKDRSASLNLIHNSKTISANGIFRPVIVINGQVAGIWRRETQRDRIIVELILYSRQDKKVRSLLTAACESFGKFLNRRIEIVFS